MKKPKGKTSGVGVIETWKIAFGKKSLKTAEQVSKFMHSEFPERKSKIFDYVNVVVSRYNAGVLSKGVKPKTKLPKYPKVKAV